MADGSDIPIPAVADQLLAACLASAASHGSQGADRLTAGLAGATYALLGSLYRQRQLLGETAPLEVIIPAFADALGFYLSGLPADDTWARHISAFSAALLDAALEHSRDDEELATSQQ